MCTTPSPTRGLQGTAATDALVRRRWRAAGKLYVIGGHEWGSLAVLRSTSVYDPTTNRWTEEAPLPAGRYNFSASPVALNGQLRMEVMGDSRPNNLAYIP